jgi:hypothetical protein
VRDREHIAVRAVLRDDVAVHAPWLPPGRPRHRCPRCRQDRLLFRYLLGGWAPSHRVGDGATVIARTEGEQAEKAGHGAWTTPECERRAGASLRMWERATSRTGPAFRCLEWFEKFSPPAWKVTASCGEGGLRPQRGSLWSGSDVDHMRRRPAGEPRGDRMPDETRPPSLPPAQHPPLQLNPIGFSGETACRRASARAGVPGIASSGRYAVPRHAFVPGPRCRSPEDAAPRRGRADHLATDRRRDDDAGARTHRERGCSGSARARATPRGRRSSPGTSTPSSPRGARVHGEAGRARLHNVTVRHGDGYAGWPEHAPFDHIVLTAAPQRCRSPRRTARRGRLVAPVGPEGLQRLMRYRSCEARSSTRTSAA